MVLPTIMLPYPTMVSMLAHHQMLCYCSLAKPDSQTKNKGPASQDYIYSILFVDKLEYAWWQKIVLDPHCLFTSVFVCAPRSSVTPRSDHLSSSLLNSSKRGSYAWCCSWSLGTTNSDRTCRHHTRQGRMLATCTGLVHTASAVG